MDKLIEEIKYNCPICNTTHLIEVRERDSAMLINSIPTPLQEIFYTCDKGEVEGSNEFGPIWIMDLNIARARAAYNHGGIPFETTDEELNDIRKAIRGETGGKDIDKIIENAEKK